MIEYYTPQTFDENRYVRSGWKAQYVELEIDKGFYRLIVRVATGRKYWPLFSLVIITELGINDPALKEVKFSLNHYTHFMIDRFIKELNIMLSDLYKIDIDLYKIESGIKKEGYYSSHNF